MFDYCDENSSMLARFHSCHMDYAIITAESRPSLINFQLAVCLVLAILSDVQSSLD